MNDWMNEWMNKWRKEGRKEGRNEGMKKRRNQIRKEWRKDNQNKKTNEFVNSWVRGLSQYSSSSSPNSLALVISIASFTEALWDLASANHRNRASSSLGSFAALNDLILHESSETAIHFSLCFKISQSIVFPTLIPCVDSVHTIKSWSVHFGCFFLCSHIDFFWSALIAVRRRLLKGCDIVTHNRSIFNCLHPTPVYQSYLYCWIGTSKVYTQKV